MSSSTVHAPARPRVSSVRAGFTAVRSRPEAYYVLLGAIIVVGLVLRLAAAHAWNATYPNSPERLILGDEPGYDNLARSLLQGHGFDWPGRVPLYPTWIATVHLLTGYDYAAIPYAQAVLGTAVIPLTFVLGRMVLGTATGLLAALGAALNLVLIDNTGPVLSEVLYTPVLLVALIALIRGLQKPSAASFAWAGLWMAIAALVRPMLFLFPLMSGPLFWILLGRARAPRAWAVYAVSTFLALTPWFVYTTVRWDAVIPLQTSNAILWQGSPEYYDLVHERHYRYLQIWTQVIYGRGWERHDPTSVEGDHWWTRRAIRSIADDPGTYLRYAAEKTGTYWVGNPSEDWADSHIFDYRRLRVVGYTRAQATGAMVARLLPILALIGVAVLWSRRRRLLALYAVAIYATALAAATYGGARLSEPLQPVLLIIVAGALVAVAAKARAMRPFAAPG